MKSHLGDLLKEGVIVLGYDLKRMNIFEDLGINGQNIPEIILVKR